MKQGRRLMNKGAIIAGLATLAALAVAIHGIGYFTHPGHAPLLRVHSGLNRTVLLIHIIGSCVAIVTGPVQFVAALRTRFPRWHRRVGYGYFAGVSVGGVAGLYSATVSMGGLVAHTGFFLLAVFWLATAAFALAAIRQRRIALHREWMVRCYALTFAAVTLRLWLPFLTAASGSFDEAYQTVAWLSWVPNLIVAEIWNRKTQP
ncbi:MAG: DUF2306 domain-containing protein [Verrucomicrobia bacterium]|nr:DUF2306 domain-containing protein [Verrucomicrobiota bacterium]